MGDVAHELFPHIFKLSHIPVLPKQKIVVVIQVVDILLDLVLHEVDLRGKFSKLVEAALLGKVFGEVVIHHALDKLTDLGQRPGDPLRKQQGKDRS